MIWDIISLALLKKTHTKTNKKTNFSLEVTYCIDNRLQPDDISQIEPTRPVLLLMQPQNELAFLSEACSLLIVLSMYRAALGPWRMGGRGSLMLGEAFPLGPARPSPEPLLWCRMLRVFELSSELRSQLLGCWTMFASVPFLMVPSGISWKPSCLQCAASPERQDRKGMCASPVTARDWGG